MLTNRFLQIAVRIDIENRRADKNHGIISGFTLCFSEGYAVNGIFDMIAIISAESTSSLDEVLDQIGDTTGVEKTVSSIILSTKIEK